MMLVWRVLGAWVKAFWFDDDEMSLLYRSELLNKEIELLRRSILDLEYSIDSAKLFGVAVPQSAFFELAGARELLGSFEAERARCCRALPA